MKKVILALCLSLSLAGCDVSTFFQGVQLATTGIANPVTKEMLYDAENGLTIVVAGLRVYKQSCVQGAIPASCRGVIKSIQGYTRQLPPLLKDLRTFVKNNDQVNAVTIYNTIQGLIANAKAIAVANGVSQ